MIVLRIKSPRPRISVGCVVDAIAPIHDDVVPKVEGDWCFRLRNLRTVRADAQWVVPDVVPNVINLTWISYLQPLTTRVVVNAVIVDVVDTAVSRRANALYAVRVDRSVRGFPNPANIVEPKLPCIIGLIGIR